MISDIKTLELYYDSGADDPREDPAEIKSKLSSIVENAEFDCTVTDTADFDTKEREELYTETVEKVRSEREYDVGGRVFTAEIFGQTRPVLVIRYEDADGIDLYPHRNDAVSGLPVRVQDFLDELDDDATSDRGDYAKLQTESDHPETTPGQQPSEEDADTQPVISRIESLVPG